ncbi:MAG TPA: roadblock/LC7 domain-containing protein [Candidatus Binatia bacterium]|nr:roadblock/LC7 domain-containing protein [Candidatus Binatia bacterium]
MRTLLRDLGTLKGVHGGYVVRRGEVLASSFPDDRNDALSASLEVVTKIGEGLAKLDSSFEEVRIEFGQQSLMVMPVDDGFTLGLLTGADVDLALLRAVMQSSVRQLRRMAELPPRPVTEPVLPPLPPLAEPAAAPAETPAAPASSAATAASAAPAGKATTPPAAAAKPAEPAKPAAQAAPPAAAAPAASEPAPAKPAAQPTPSPQAAKPAVQPAPPKQAVPPKPSPAEQAQKLREAKAAQHAAQQGKGRDGRPEQKKPAPAPEPARAPSRDDWDAETVLPKIRDLLTEAIGPVARVTFKRGVAKWTDGHAPTLGNLPALAKILAADLGSEAEKKKFVDAVERLRQG